jgi:hypothetical protein
MENEALQQMTTNISTFFRLEEQDSNMHVELGDNAKYLVIGMCSVSFHMPVGEVLELHEVLYVPSSTKNLLLVSCLTNDEVFSKFQEFKTLVVNQKCKKLKILRSNNGGEHIPPRSLIPFVEKQRSRGS